MKYFKCISNTFISTFSSEYKFKKKDIKIGEVIGFNSDRKMEDNTILIFFDIDHFEDISKIYNRSLIINKLVKDE